MKRAFPERNQPHTKRRRLTFTHSSRLSFHDILKKSSQKLETTTVKLQVKKEKVKRLTEQAAPEESDDITFENVDIKEQTRNLILQEDPFEFVRPPMKFAEGDQSVRSSDRDLVNQMYAVNQPSYKNETYDDTFQYSWFRGKTKTPFEQRGFPKSSIPLSITQQKQVASGDRFKMRNEQPPAWPQLPIPKKTVEKKSKKKKKTVPGEKEHPKRLTDDQRRHRRQRQITFGKNTEGYKNYIRLVPKSQRMASEHFPVTPDLDIAASKRNFDKMTRQWRRDLHRWDTEKLTDVQLRLLKAEPHDEKEGRIGTKSPSQSKPLAKDEPVVTPERYLSSPERILVQSAVKQETARTEEWTLLD